MLGWGTQPTAVEKVASEVVAAEMMMRSSTWWVEVWHARESCRGTCPCWGVSRAGTGAVPRYLVVILWSWSLPRTVLSEYHVYHVYHVSSMLILQEDTCLAAEARVWFVQTGCWETLSPGWWRAETGGGGDHHASSLLCVRNKFLLLYTQSQPQFPSSKVMHLPLKEVFLNIWRCL